MNYYIHYQGGAGGDFLRVCLWLLLNPKLKISWDSPSDWENEFGAKGKAYTCTHEVNGKKYGYSFFSLMDNGSVKPIGSFSHIGRGEIVKGRYFRSIIPELSFYLSTRDNKNYSDIFEYFNNLEMKNTEDSLPDTGNSVWNSHLIYHAGIGAVQDVMKYLKEKCNHIVDLHIGIMPKDPIDSIIIRYVDGLKNEIPTNWNRVNTMIAENNDDAVGILLQNFYQHKVMYDYILGNDGFLIDFRNLMLSGPYDLAKQLSKKIDNIQISQSYLDFFKMYNNVNNWEDIFNGKEVTNLREFFEERAGELKTWQ